jgi:hypothetical protein
MSNQLVAVPFHGDVIEAVQDAEGKVWVSLRRCCESLGVLFEGQLVKLRKEEWATIEEISMVAQDGKEREVTVIDLESLPGWLFSIKAGKVNPDVRPKLIRYQKEAARVLADHFLGRKAETPQATPPVDPITAQLQALLVMRQTQLALEAQQNALTVRVDQVAEKADAAVALANAAGRTADSNYGYFSVLAYCNRIKRELSSSDASHHGKRLTAICKQAGIAVNRIADQRFGYVNLYPERVLKTYFEDC